MALQYWVGDFFVDLSRNQITQKKQSQTIAPKALAVLTYLAENQGQVVSQDALLAKVWQDTAVTPNTLQRSIAQLRKALGDNGKVQIYIKTHAKQGYSLECDVRWDNSFDPLEPQRTQSDEAISTIINENQKNTQSVKQDKKHTLNLKLFFVALVAMAFFIWGYPYFSPTNHAQLKFDTLRTLTATDDKEFDATYSPDGQYIVFHRYLDKQCVNKIWAKNINNQQEVLLTREWGNYGGHSFSEDGKTIVFLATEPCDDQSTSTNCYNLMSLDFEKALTSPQQPQLILQCNNSTLRKPIWLGKDHIALFQRQTNRWKLIKYSIPENKSTDIYDLKEGNLSDFAYSARDGLIAVVSFHNDGKQYIEMLKPDGRIVSSHPIELPPEIPKHRSVNPNFDPLNKQLVFSTGRQLFTLSYEGKVAKINIPSGDKMALPEFHPDGNRLLLIKGPYDSDIVMLPLDRTAETGETSPPARVALRLPASYTPFERSNLGEDYAVFQPGGDLIAFWSERSGQEQLWISDGQGALQLTDFPIDTYIRGIKWAADGESLLISANYEMRQVFLDGKQKSFPCEYPAFRLYHWDSENNTALFLSRVEGILALVAFDLNTLSVREVFEKNILHAQKSEDGRLIYKDYQGRFWQPGPVEDLQIRALDNQGGRSKSFVMHGNVIYAINKENQVWSYDLDTEIFHVLGEVGEDVDYLTDVNGTQLLMTIEVAAKKEVVELSMNN